MSEASKKRILLVDDSKFVRTTFKSILSRSFAVVEAADGDAGWEAIRGDPSIVLVFSDLNMPKLDGYGLLARVRKSEDARIRQLPVVIISGHEDDAAKKRARETGANDFISKTADGTEILARIENLLKLADTTQTATHDPVSGALTLHYLITEGRKHLSAARRHNSPLSVMVVSIDNHAELAQTLGEQASGELLKRIASLINSGMRAEDSLGRTGEATFTLVSAGTAAPQALAFARRLHEKLQGAQIRLSGKVHTLRATFGVASLGLDQVDSIEELMKRALERMRKPEAQPVVPPPAPAAAPAEPLALPADVELAMKLLETAAGRVGEEARPTLIQRLQALVNAIKAPAKAG
jgi:two-component system, cell cycle response regulator